MEAHIEINGQKITVPEGTTIMAAANRLGVYIPHFCYHPKLSIAANCRMCMVDVEKAPKAMPACATPVMDGMVVRVDSPKAKAAQHGVMEFLLINHPLDCPICDQGGECQLQDLAVGYGISRSRYQEEKRIVFEKNLGPLISTDMTRCIHCTRCVRFGREVAGVMELGMTGRGEHAEIMPFIEKTVDSELSGNMIDVCPVGALTSKPFRFTARAWELDKTPAIATHDSWGSHVLVHSKTDEVKRVVPDHSPGIHEHWVSDRDRFSYEGLNHPARAHAPLAKVKDGNLLKETSWHKALNNVVEGLQGIIKKHGAEAVGFFVSPRASVEEAYLTQAIARHLGCENIESRLFQRDFSSDNTSGDVVGLGVEKLSDLQTALFVGAEPARELPLLAAYLRTHEKRTHWMSISPLDMRASLHLEEQWLVRPELLAEQLIEMNVAAGGNAPDNWKRNAALFAQNAEQSDTHKRIVAQLKKAGEHGIIWLGDIARSHEQYGVIMEMARALAAQVGCRLGVLSDLANGAGARRAGAVPSAAHRHINTSQLLAAKLKAVVMVRCEADDFCMSQQARRMLANAEFVCTLSSHTDEAAAQAASVVLPCADFAESEGTTINGFGNITHFGAVVSAPSQVKPAWKILRVLGELLGAPQFDFSDLNSLRARDDYSQAIAATESKADAAVDITALDYEPLSVNGFSHYGGQGAYAGDALVRHATALQATKQGQARGAVSMCAADIAALGAKVGDAVLVNDSEQRTIALDDRLVQGCVRCYGMDASTNIALAAAKKQEVPAAAAATESAEVAEKIAEEQKLA